MSEMNISQLPNAKPVKYIKVAEHELDRLCNLIDFQFKTIAALREDADDLYRFIDSLDCDDELLMHEKRELAQKHTALMKQLDGGE